MCVCAYVCVVFARVEVFCSIFVGRDMHTHDDVMACSVLQCIAVCCSVLQCVAATVRLQKEGHVQGYAHRR